MRTRAKILWRGRHIARALYAVVAALMAVSAYELGREWTGLPLTTWGIEVVVSLAVVGLVGMSWLLSVFIRDVSGGLEEVTRDARDIARTIVGNSGGEQRSAVGSFCTARENVRLQEGRCPDCGSRLNGGGQTVDCEDDGCSASFQVAEPLGVRVDLRRLSYSKRISTGQE
jgi:hypothetical protein